MFSSPALPLTWLWASPVHFSRPRIWKSLGIGPLLITACFAGALDGRSADAQMRLPSDNIIEISGGSGSHAWTIRYGTGTFHTKKFVTSDGHRAWLSHGGWLRLIDTEKGVVVGRWHFPGSMVHLTPVGRSLQIQMEEKEGNRIFTRLTTFDPEGHETISYWPSGNLTLNRVPFIEVESLWGTSAKVGILSADWRLTSDQEPSKLISTLEEASRRDPLDPAIRIALWRVLRDVQDPRAPRILEESLSIPSTDFTEMLPIASLLEALDEPAAARRAFEAGYQDYLNRGNDPRLNTALIGKLILYPSKLSSPPDFATDRGRELMERHYRLGPYCESADLAWTAYARIMDQQGRAEDARKWRARSVEASHTSIFLLPRRFTLFSDILLLIIIAALASAGLYPFLLWIRYRPQRRADALNNPGRGLGARIWAAFGFPHWSRGERVAFFSIVLVVWFGLGTEAGILRGVSRVAATPLNLAMGSLAGPVPQDYLEHQVPPTPERNLLLAFAHHQSGRLEQAEGLYRSLPDFAESWNNLGAILSGKGNQQEAKQAYEKALQLDSGLGEAAVNLGQPPRGYWAEQFAHYFPGRSMLAPPSPQRVSAALLGSSLRQIIVRGLGGPLADWKSFGTVFFLSGTGSEDAPAAHLLPALALLFLVLAIALLFVPSRAVTQPPPRGFAFAQILFPGLAGGWSFLGGWVFVAWVYFLIQLFLILKIGTPYILTSIAQPGLARTYNVPAGQSEPLFQFLNPGWTWIYLAPVVLFLVNLGLVAISRRSAHGRDSSVS